MSEMEIVYGWGAENKGVNKGGEGNKDSEATGSSSSSSSKEMKMQFINGRIMGGLLL